MKKRLLASMFLSFILLFNISAMQNTEIISPILPRYIPIIVQRESPYWDAVTVGAEEAARDYGVNIHVLAPQTLSPDALSEQLSLFQNALAAAPMAIVLSALDPGAFTPYLEQAQAQNIPVIALDSDVDSPIVRTAVATDNYDAGVLAAHQMARLIGGSGKVGILIHRPQIRSASYRRDGFINTLTQNYPNIEILPLQYGNGTPESLTLGAAALIQTPDINGIFGTNRDATEAIIDASKQYSKAQTLAIIGFDASQMISEAIREGIVSGAIAQDPATMGYLAVEYAIRASMGEILPTFINTGFFWYDIFNIDNPQIRALLYE